MYRTCTMHQTLARQEVNMENERQRHTRYACDLLILCHLLIRLLWCNDAMTLWTAHTPPSLMGEGLAGNLLTSSSASCSCSCSCSCSWAMQTLSKCVDHLRGVLCVTIGERHGDFLAGWKVTMRQGQKDVRRLTCRQSWNQ